MSKLSLLILFLASLAQAEYRVFKLQFTNTKTKQVRFIQSTLDPVQYRSIYQPKDETITYVQTWRCRGATDGFKPHCQSPEMKPTTPPL